MITYANFRPTTLDSHLGLEGREHWYVVPCARNRDSDTWEMSNFETALTMLGEESETVEIHRFGHWGPGWFEIILVNPEDKERVQCINQIEDKLKEYPYLDEDDVSRREADEGGFAGDWRVIENKD